MVDQQHSEPSGHPVLAELVIEKLVTAARAALKRRSTQEEKLAGAIRALAPYSQTLRALLVEVVETLVRRGALERPLYGGSIRGLAESDPASAGALLEAALSLPEAGGWATLSAASIVADPRLDGALERAAVNRHPHIALSAEIARAARGGGDGQRAAAIAPKLKESHRIALCLELLVPLLRRDPLPTHITPALRVLRESERHLGRWLVFAELAKRAGDDEPLVEAKRRARSSGSSARGAWEFVAWALEPLAAQPNARPTVELVSRLSDRPSADRDPTFLYRLAEGRVSSARPMLENFTKSTSLKSEVSIRSAMYLARDYERSDLLQALKAAAQSARVERLRGVAAAAFHEAGGSSDGLCERLRESRQLTTVAWAGLLELANNGHLDRLLTEPRFRQIQLGWVG